MSTFTCSPAPWVPGDVRWIDHYGNMSLTANSGQRYQALQATADGRYYVALVQMDEDDQMQADNLSLIQQAPELYVIAKAFQQYLLDDSRSQRRRAENLAAVRHVLDMIEREHKS